MEGLIMMKLPIGTQDFRIMRENDYLYVDKTKYIHQLIEEGRIYFLSRPRRFGKSLLVSTIAEIFKCNEELFKGLYIRDKWDWDDKYPVIHFDLSNGDFKTPKKLENSLIDMINRHARELDVPIYSKTLNGQFTDLIFETYKKTGKKVVVLVDEYDKAIIKNISNLKVLKENLKILQSFYAVLKSSDEHIRFVFITGVSKFTGTSLFSDFNSPNDITLYYRYSNICGYTQEDLETQFHEHITEVAKYFDCSNEKLLKWIKKWYNGYSWNGEDKVYNPFSILNFFSKSEFSNYWYGTATPTLLLEHIKYKNNLKPILEPVTVFSNFLDSYDPSHISEIPLLFQTGYLTIIDKDIHGEVRYTLDIPNLEVKKSFFDNLLKVYVDKSLEEIQELKMNLIDNLKDGDSELLRENILIMLSNIPYEIHGRDERYYHSVFLVWLKTLGFKIESNISTNKGEIDSTIKLNNETILIEIKYSKSEEEESLIKSVDKAFNQIHEREYFQKYLNSKNLKLLAIAFNRKDVKCEFRSTI
jgi:Holliday junction resolvase-like predicted endonuclease